MKQEATETQSCCIMKKEGKSDENPYMKIAVPQYTSSIAGPNTNKQPTMKHRYVCSTEQSTITASTTVNPIQISHRNLSGRLANATTRPVARAESLFHCHLSQNKFQDSKSFPLTSNPTMYRVEEQPAGYRELVRRKYGRPFILL